MSSGSEQSLLVQSDDGNNNIPPINNASNTSIGQTDVQFTGKTLQQITNAVNAYTPKYIIEEDEIDEEETEIDSSASSNLFQPSMQHMIASIQSFKVKKHYSSLSYCTKIIQKAENKKFESKSYDIIQQRITLASNAIQIASNNSQILQEKLVKKRSEISYLFPDDIFQDKSNSNEQQHLPDKCKFISLLNERYIYEQEKCKSLNETLLLKNRELNEARLKNMLLKQDGQRLYFDQQMKYLRNQRKNVYKNTSFVDCFFFVGERFLYFKIIVDDEKSVDDDDAKLEVIDDGTKRVVFADMIVEMPAESVSREENVLKEENEIAEVLDLEFEDDDIKVDNKCVSELKFRPLTNKEIVGTNGFDFI